MNWVPILNRILISVLVISSIIISSFSSKNNGCTDDFPGFGHTFLPDCDDGFHNSKNYFIAITLNGKINIIDAIEGKIKWTREIQSNPLISSTIGNYMKIQNGNGELVQILPSLDGNLYVYEDGKIEKTEFSAEKLLKSSLKFNENILLVGGQESKIMGLNLNSGDLIYDCGHAGCSEENCSTFGDMVLLRKNSQSVRAINTMTGHEEWHFVVDDPQVIHVSNQECHSYDESPYTITFKVMLPTGQIKTLVHFTNDSMQSEIYNTWNLTLDSPIVNMWHLINKDLVKIDLFDPDINSFESFIPKHVEQSSYLYLGSFNNHPYIQTSSNQNELIQYNDDKDYKNQQQQDFIPLEPEQSDAQKQSNDTQLVVSDGRFSFLKNNQNNNATGFLVFQYNNNVVHLQSEECSSTDIVPEVPSETIYVYITEYVYISLSYYWKEILCLCLIFSAAINTLWCLIKQWVRKIIPNESLPCSNDSCLADPETRNKNDHQYDAPPKRNKFSIVTNRLVLSPEPENNPNYNSRFLEDFEPLCLLGQGGFGRVFEAKHKIDESHYAVKRIRIPAIEEKPVRFTREIRALSQLDHVNIVRYYNAWVEEPPIGWQEKQDQLDNYNTTSTFSETSFVSKSQPQVMRRVESFVSEEDDDSLEIVFKESSNNNTQTEKSSKIDSLNVDTNTRLDNTSAKNEDLKWKTANNHQQKNFPPKPKAFIYIQMQLCQKETLKDWLFNNFERDNALIIDMFVQILKAVNYVHSHNLIHRDLKPSNIFFSKDGLIKIGDFGLVTTDHCDDQQESTSLVDSKSSKHTTYVGTKLYMSPEQIKNQSYDHKVDIYSMGIILYELLIPFKTESERIQQLQNARKQRFSDILLRKHSKEKTIIEKLLAESPNDRPETDELLKYDLFCAN